MIRKTKYCFFIILFFFKTVNLFAQIDSTKANKAAVKQEMVSMQQQLNSFLLNNSSNNNSQSVSILIPNWQLKFDSIHVKLEEQQKEIEELKKRLIALETKKATTPEVVSKKFDNVIGVLYFELGSYVLSEENKSIINNIIKLHSDKTLQLVAYTDWTGNNETNQKLSDQRALSVQNELTNNGILIQNLRIYSKGKMAEENQNLSAKECRRVEIRY